jgi:hypothetical protein
LWFIDSIERPQPVSPSAGGAILTEMVRHGSDGFEVISIEKTAFINLY